MGPGVHPRALPVGIRSRGEGEHVERYEQAKLFRCGGGQERCEGGNTGRKVCLHIQTVCGAAG